MNSLVPLEFYYEQYTRYEQKPQSVQNFDAIVADLGARGLWDLDPDPRSAAFQYTLDYMTEYDLDSGYFSPEHVQPQFDLFDKLDYEEGRTDIEPDVYRTPPASDNDIARVIEEFQQHQQLADSSGRIYTTAELVQYYKERSAELTQHANDRIKAIRGEK